MLNLILFITKYYIIRKNKPITIKLDRADQHKEKKPGKRDKNQRPTLSHIQESHENTELKPKIYMQKTW